MPKSNKTGGVMYKSSSEEEEMPTLDPRENDHGIMLAKRRTRNQNFHHLDSLETPMKSPREMAAMIENDNDLRSTQVTKSYT